MQLPGQGQSLQTHQRRLFPDGRSLREDPFVLFQLRGRNWTRLLEDLAEHRRKALAELAQKAKEAKADSVSSDATPLPPHAQCRIRLCGGATTATWMAIWS